jgi:hypothetical protein
MTALHPPQPTKIDIAMKIKIKMKMKSNIRKVGEIRARVRQNPVGKSYRRQEEIKSVI